MTLASSITHLANFCEKELSNVTTGSVTGSLRSAGVNLYSEYALNYLLGLAEIFTVWFSALINPKVLASNLSSSQWVCLSSSKHDIMTGILP